MIVRLPTDSCGRQFAIERRTLHARLGPALALISSCARVAHSGSSLWDHLLGTFEILCAWGVRPDVSVAGLIHSIYATQYFRMAVVRPERRREVARAVGPHTERLAYLFCVIDRNDIRNATATWPRRTDRIRLREHESGHAVRMSGSIVRQLRLIDLANEIEQRQRTVGPPTGWFAELCAAFRAIRFRPSGFRSELDIDRGAEQRLLRHYRDAVRTSGQESVRLLSRCIDDVPRCAEARLLLAAALLKTGDATSAYLHARVALEDLHAWGAVWDTRAPLLAWDLMGRQLVDAARRHSRTAPALVRAVRDQLRSRSITSR
jgi:hypothetical protein